MAAGFIPFQPTGPTVSGPATTSNSVLHINTTVVGGITVPASRLRLYNSGPQDAFVAFGTDTSTTAVLGSSYPVPAGSIEIITAPQGWMAMITQTSTTTIFATPGEGI